VLNAPVARFELRRRIDAQVYRFTRAARDDGQPGYRRDDRDLWILRCTRRGWIAIDPDSGDVTGRPWDAAPADQGDAPPPGRWVSCKGDKSCVHDLVHLDEPAPQDCERP
jgi:hypothetical protein